MAEGIRFSLIFFSYYGLVIAFSIFAGALLAQYQARKHGEDLAFLWEILPWILIVGLVGARLWHVFTPTISAIEKGLTTEYYLSHPFALIDLRKGGLGMMGAIIGGALTLFLFSRFYRVSFLKWADILAPGVALGQAIGRWGDFVNQAAYGIPTSLPWKIFIDPLHRLSAYAEQAYYHPFFLYESLLSFGAAAFLFWLGRRHSEKLKTGDLLLVYLVIYSGGRALLETLRLDIARIGNANINQDFVAVVAVFALLSLLWRHRKNA